MGLKEFATRGIEFQQRNRIRKNKMTAWSSIILGIVLIFASIYALIAGNFKVAGILFLIGVVSLIAGIFIKKYAHVRGFQARS